MMLYSGLLMPNSWRRFMIASSAFLLLAAVPSVADDVEPGLWRVTVDLNVDTANGEALSTPHTEHEEETTCVSGWRGNISKIFAEEALPEGCSAGSVLAANGKITFNAVCPPDEDDVVIQMSGVGTYTGSKMSIDIKASAQSDGNQATMSGKIVGTRLGHCSPGK